MIPIRFGTAGWRAIIAQDFTFQNVRIVAQAIADYLKSQKLHHKQTIVGYDSRFLSEDFARAVSEVITANSIQILLCQRDAPTPAIALEILRRKAAGSINITASHNPPEYSGIKFSTSWGGPALPEVTRELEERCALYASEGKTIPRLSLNDGRKKKLVLDLDPSENYMKQIRNLIDFKALKKAKLSVVCDLLYGTARDYLDTLLKESGSKVTVLHDHRDVLFGGHAPDPSRENLSELMETMKRQKSDIGLATDGDSDRFGIIDSDGSFLTPNEILPLVLDHLIRTRNWKGVVARSVMTSHFLDAVAKNEGIEVRETPVGFKYIAEVMLKENFILGGEESGGLTIKGHIPEKDGILACLLLAEVRAAAKKPLRQSLLELQKKVGFFYTHRSNFHVPLEKMNTLKDKLSSHPPTTMGEFHVKRIVDLDGIKFIMKDQSWLGIRLSGTEPVVRMYVESDSQKKLDKLIAHGKRLIV
ncbi:MAG: phosphoglucomutase/phosphomannomutase family protein [Elusimicrobia bacterium]|nr:phosphoglucomutase/phosphomannomutase family protein [Elusimicrobiota bacterium]MBI2915510.1 phosphoglucomutase/phosphomannomutase family protein [Elusimicrobiota bacterium]MBI4217913.1 phosphoglucomutase/phosphomannomutase family protein [Elusimicrobiota bacterium]